LFTCGSFLFMRETFRFRPGTIGFMHETINPGIIKKEK
jgi:hypothetical protein